MGTGAIRIVAFTFLVPKKLVVIDSVDMRDYLGNTVAEKIDLHTNGGGAPVTDEKHGKVVEENIAAQEIKPIEGAEFVAEEVLTKEEVQSQKRLAWVFLNAGA